MMENWPDLRADNPLPLNKAGVPSKRKMSRFPYKEITVPQCWCKVGKPNPYCTYLLSTDEDLVKKDIYLQDEAEQSAENNS